ncbi:hypothetical protein BC829DRAFT_404358 [Chytridium lagenaria]|nr:hypothetical protein BC829DRAFT_404358 [Chytridium lagenaria]
MDACQIPRYTSFAVFQCVDNGRKNPTISCDDFIAWWKDVNSVYRDDFAVVDRHPGLEFLASMPVFQARYVETVTTRIFYEKKQNWSEKMTIPDLRRHPFLFSLRNVQQEDDINATRDFFSYKHFYVIYCKFWELDADHDMFIEGEDLYRYDRGALTTLAVKRILSGVAMKLTSGSNSNRLSYKDFIWFLMSVEDKRTVGSIEYWFRCLDLDGDGIVSLHELRDFYNEQFDRMIEFRMNDPWRFEDLCAASSRDSQISLTDLKKSSNSALFFDMIFDLRKYDTHIRRIDPGFREADDVWVEERGKRIKLEGWDKFAERTYDELAMEERRSQSRSTYSGYTSYEVEDLDEEWGDDDGDVEVDHDTVGGWGTCVSAVTENATEITLEDDEDWEDDEEKKGSTNDEEMEEDEPMEFEGVRSAAKVGKSS